MHSRRLPREAGWENAKSVQHYYIYCIGKSLTQVRTFTYSYRSKIFVLAFLEGWCYLCSWEQQLGGAGLMPVLIGSRRPNRNPATWLHFSPAPATQVQWVLLNLTECTPLSIAECNTLFTLWCKSKIRPIFILYCFWYDLQKKQVNSNH